MGHRSTQTEVDREMHRHIHAAVRALGKALTVIPKKHDHPTVSRRMGVITQTLRGALSLLEGIGSTQPRWDTSDPDLMPEHLKKARQKASPPPPPVVIGGNN